MKIKKREFLLLKVKVITPEFARLSEAHRFPQKAQVCDFSANVRSVQQTILSQNSCCGFAAWLPRPSESPGLLDM